VYLLKKVADVYDQIINIVVHRERAVGVSHIDGTLESSPGLKNVNAHFDVYTRGKCAVDP
jgi:hypothetical protein